MFKDIKVGDYVMVRKGLTKPYEKEIVMEVNDTFFKCEHDDNTYNIKTGMCCNYPKIIPYAIRYDDETWEKFCNQVAINKRRKKAIDVIKDFYQNPDNTVDMLEAVVEFINKNKG